MRSARCRSHDRRATRWALVALALCATGCRSLFNEETAAAPRSILQPAAGAADGVRFEVYWATLPAALEGDDQEGLWRFVQEERLDERTRLRLRKNGFRAGVVGGVPPKALVRLLNPLGQSETPDPTAAAVDEPARLSAATGVKRQITTVRPELPAEVNASEVTDSVMLMLADDEGVIGEPFHRVQAIYRLGVELRSEGGVLTTLTPELHFGEPRMRWVADDSGLISRPKPLRDQRVFSDLRIDAPLVVGEMLIVTSLPDRSDSRLGGFFHRADDGVEGRRKAIVVRVVEAPPSPDFTVARSDTRPDF